MKAVREILYKVNINKVIGDTGALIGNVVSDSREVIEKDLYIAINGVNVDGHKFINSAIKKGAICVVCEVLPNKLQESILYVVVESTRESIGIISSNYFSNPSSKLKLIGITGTNGKTTIATLLYNLYNTAGLKAGLISTVINYIDGKEIGSTQTTPDSLTINKLLHQMVKEGIQYCFMEVSSHGIEQRRISGLEFAGGIFSNLTHDHLDYHNSFDQYRDVKKDFFDNLPNTAFSLVNKDDKNGKYMVQNTKSKIFTYGLKTYADYKIKILESSLEGMLLKINESEFWSNLSGKFNAYNLLAIFSTATILGMPFSETLQLMSMLKNVKGRFEYLRLNNITAIVDYAHTPDALKNIINSINEIKTNKESLITIIGCGGDRDKSKRPVMGDIASSLSSKVIFTSDNPRNESPETIIQDMVSGVKPLNSVKTISIANRKEAIKTACQLAKSNDIILIAGKGHETFQEINNKKHLFDDYKVVKECLTKMN
ncbi:MAG: UDP-N-acetylmuramoyl-L-alanyl-D-glutamate--2,6-diaminopimelate ligase [Candidatus Marinimicrobia bacterium]|nr:UDP-N-acetylmuramoyl-L-alanyl-D-glutamate--2,6-diaminopimelate ligase [Candidatus Neomarinimicrobiota bacterium]